MSNPASPFARFSEADRLLATLLARPAAEREAVLDELRSEGRELGAEVAELLRLAEEEDALLVEGGALAGEFGETFTEESVAHGGATLPVGSGLRSRRFGPWRIVRELGCGGMAVVYLAERADGAYEQQVALKLLQTGPQASELVERFERERQILASLRHPHIAGLIDGGLSEDGQPWFAMEYVEGSRVDRYCDKHRLSVDERLALFIQIAQAVQAAHRALVVHRDLKPSNILVTKEGEPRLLDFGIAKPLDPEGGTAAATRTLPMLTPEYASPEQVRGEPVTTASDVYQLGLLLYELLTGVRGQRVASRSATELERVVLEQTPSPPSVAARTGDAVAARAEARRTTAPELARRLSGDLDAIVLQALRKEPERRYASAAELAEDVRRHLAALPVTARPDSLPYRVGKFVRRHAVGVTATFGMMLLGAAIVTLVRSSRAWREATPPRIGRVVQLTSLAGVEDAPSWSPDGQSIVYTSDAAGNLDIYVQRVAGGPAIRLTHSEADDALPAWSPDGRWIAFVSARARTEKRLRMHPDMGSWTSFFPGGNGDVWVMPARGGTARKIAEDGYFPTWSPDGRHLLYQTERGGRWEFRIEKVNGSGDTRVLELREFPSSFVRTQSAWSPDGEWIAFIGGLGDDLSLYVVPSQGGSPRELVRPTALTPTWSADGRWLYFSSTRGGAMNLWRARFDQGRLEGAPQPLTTGRGEDVYARVDPRGEDVAYSALRRSMNIWSVHLASGETRAVFRESALQDYAQPSPDGSHLAFASNRRGDQHLWILDRASGGLTRVSEIPATRSAWTPDGGRLLFLLPKGLWEYDVGRRRTRKIFTGPVFPFGGLSVTPNGEEAVLSLRPGEMGTLVQIVRLDLATGETEPVSSPTADPAFDPILSPDGDRLAVYVQVGPRGRAIWTAPLAGDGTPLQLTAGDNEDSHPAWSADGRLVYFVRNHQDLYAVPATGGDPWPITRYRSFSTAIEYPAATADGGSVLFSRIDNAGDIFVLHLADHRQR